VGFVLLPFLFHSVEAVLYGLANLFEVHQDLVLAFVPVQLVPLVFLTYLCHLFHEFGEDPLFDFQACRCLERDKFPQPDVNIEFTSQYLPAE